MRDDFTLATKRTLADRVNLQCSNPNCQKPTSAPRLDPEKSINVGFAAHITAAAAGGARYDQSLTTEQREAVENGIWLCGTCAKLIDTDPARYAVEVLREWKRSAEEAALASVERGFSAGNGVTNEDDEWADKFTEAVRHITNLMPRIFMGTPGPAGIGRSSGAAYSLVFPDLSLRQRIEAQLVSTDSSRRHAQARTLDVNQLRLRPVRKTIQEVLDRVEQVKNTDKELATRLNLY